MASTSWQSSYNQWGWATKFLAWTLVVALLAGCASTHVPPMGYQGKAFRPEPDERQLWITNVFGNAVEVFSVPEHKLLGSVPVGLAPNLVADVYSLLLAAKTATGAAILLVEQNVEEALPLADYLYLLNLGQVKAEGPGRDFDNSRVRALVQECLLG